jgi:hypothetical protein
MAQTTTEHLLLAIEEVLTSTTGKVRELAAAHQFGKGLPPGVDTQLRSVRCRDHANRKAVFVAIGEIVVSDEVTTELASDHLYELSIVISRDYHLGYEFAADEVRATMIRVSDDFMRVRKALCHPSALDETVGETATGIAHGGLRSTGAKSQLRVERIGEGRDRLVNALDRFECAFLFTPGD